MEIILNGKKMEVEPKMTVRHLIEQLGYDQKAVAVAVNENFVPRSSYDQTPIQESDRIEFVAPMAGG